MDRTSLSARQPQPNSSPPSHSSPARAPASAGPVPTAVRPASPLFDAAVRQGQPTKVPLALPGAPLGPQCSRPVEWRTPTLPDERLPRPVQPEMIFPTALLLQLGENEFGSLVKAGTGIPPDKGIIQLRFSAELVKKRRLLYMTAREYELEREGGIVVSRMPEKLKQLREALPPLMPGSLGVLKVTTATLGQRVRGVDNAFLTVEDFDIIVESLVHPAQMPLESSPTRVHFNSIDSPFFLSMKKDGKVLEFIAENPLARMRWLMYLAYAQGRPPIDLSATDLQASLNERRTAVAAMIAQRNIRTGSPRALALAKAVTNIAEEDAKRRREEEEAEKKTKREQYEAEMAWRSQAILNTPSAKARLPPPDNHANRIWRIYVMYAPDKASNITKALELYPGKEEMLIRALVKKYGPEPSDEQLINKIVEQPGLVLPPLPQTDVGGTSSTAELQRAGSLGPLEMPSIIELSAATNGSSGPVSQSPDPEHSVPEAIKVARAAQIEYILAEQQQRILQLEQQHAALLLEREIERKQLLALREQQISLEVARSEADKYGRLDQAGNNLGSDDEHKNQPDDPSSTASSRLDALDHPEGAEASPKAIITRTPSGPTPQETATTLDRVARETESNMELIEKKLSFIAEKKVECMNRAGAIEMKLGAHAELSAEGKGTGDENHGGEGNLCQEERPTNLHQPQSDLIMRQAALLRRQQRAMATQELLARRLLADERASHRRQLLLMRARLYRSARMDYRDIDLDHDSITFDIDAVLEESLSESSMANSESDEEFEDTGSTIGDKDTRNRSRCDKKRQATHADDDYPEDLEAIMAQEQADEATLYSVNRAEGRRLRRHAQRMVKQARLKASRTSPRAEGRNDGGRTDDLDYEDEETRRESDQDERQARYIREQRQNHIKHSKRALEDDQKWLLEVESAAEQGRLGGKGVSEAVYKSKQAQAEDNLALEPSEAALVRSAVSGDATLRQRETQHLRERALLEAVGDEQERHYNRMFLQKRRMLGQANSHQDPSSFLDPTINASSISPPRSERLHGSGTRDVESPPGHYSDNKHNNYWGEQETDRSLAVAYADSLLKQSLFIQSPPVQPPPPLPASQVDSYGVPTVLVAAVSVRPQPADAPLQVAFDEIVLISHPSLRSAIYGRLVLVRGGGQVLLQGLAELKRRLGVRPNTDMLLPVAALAAHQRASLHDILLFPKGPRDDIDNTNALLATSRAPSNVRLQWSVTGSDQLSAMLRACQKAQRHIDAQSQPTASVEKSPTKQVISSATRAGAFQVTCLNEHQIVGLIRALA